MGMGASPRSWDSICIGDFPGLFKPKIPLGKSDGHRILRGDQFASGELRPFIFPEEYGGIDRKSQVGIGACGTQEPEAGDGTKDTACVGC